MLASAIKTGLRIGRDAAFALIYPQACAVCRASVESHDDLPACAACWSETRLIRGLAICSRCGAPLLSSEIVSQCQLCSSLTFTAARAVGLYEGALRAAILDLKRKPYLGARLRNLLLELARVEPLHRATCIVPVPLHRQRERERGFNQAAIIARAIARRTGWPVREEALIRVVHTQVHRTLMDERARRESVAGAFAVAKRRLIEGEDVLLVDDVFTTGATVSACAQALLEAGARAVFVLTIARVVRAEVEAGGIR